MASNRPKVPGGRVHWLLVFTILMLVSSAVPVLAEESPERPPESAGFTPPTSKEEEVAAAQIPDASEVSQAIGKVEREEEEEKWLATPEAKAERESTWHVFGDLSAGESEELLRSLFGEQLEALNGDPSRFLSDAQLVRPLGDTGAVVTDEGEGSLLETTVPVRAEDEDGQLARVDLSLKATPEGFQSENAISDLVLPSTADEAIKVGEEGIEIAQRGAADSSANRFGDKNLFYPSVLPDTDLLVAGTSFGAELFDLLRSKDSPEDLSFDVNVPVGAELRSDGRGGAEVIRGEETITLIPKPTATDAQGTEVPVELEVSEGSIVLHLNHRSGDYAYPILLDPIVEDWANTENSWYNGHRWEALSNGAWQWTSNNSNVAHDICCWEGSHAGLLMNMKAAFYGPEQFGQWSYSTANEHVLIVHAWITPFARADGGCSSSQPHDYAGLWNPGEQWHPILTNEAKNHGFVSMDGFGQAFVIGESSGPPGVWTSCDRLLYAGGVALWLDDTWGPGISYAGVPSGGWFGDQAPATISVNSWDEGLGVWRVKVLNEGKGVVAEDWVGKCTGLYGARCPTEHSSQFNNITGDSFGEGIRNSSVTVSDPTGKTAEKFFTTKVDNSPPEVALSGQLAKATGEEVSFGEEEPPVGAGEDELNLPVYKLKIEAKDGSKASDKAKRSGVKDIKVFLDGKAMSVPWSPLPSCPETSCEMTQTYRLILTGLSAGSHKLEVKAEDLIKEVKVREIEFEYIPATGMKDEYVMQHFPLPDGQCDPSAQEESEACPELAVNLMNGNLVFHERDVDVEGPAVDLELERFYNSQLPDAENTEWGDGWTLAQTPDLKPIKSEGSPVPDKADLVSSDGALATRVALPTTAGSQTFDPALQATLIKKSSGGYELTDATGQSSTSVSFSEAGRTEARLTEGAARVDYDYENGVLSEIEVSDPATFSADPKELEELGPSLIEKPTYASAFGSNGSGDGQFKATTGLAIDLQGNIWVADKENNRIQKFDPSGKFLAKYGSFGSGDGQFKRPSSIAVDRDGNILVADSNNNRIEKFDTSGKFLAKFGSLGSGDGQFSKPEAVAADSKGNIWVSDYLNARVQKFDEERKFLKAFGTGTLGGPMGLSVDPASGNVWVADWQKNRVSVYNSNGELQSQVGSGPGSGNGQLNHPATVAIDNQGNAWVGDKENNRIERFNLAGQYVGQFGSAGAGQGQFALDFPMGIATDSKGHLWVSDPGHSRVQGWLVPIEKPTYASAFGSNGSGDGQFKATTGLAIDLQGNIWVADKENNRIQKFDPSGKFLAKYGSFGSGDGQFKRPSSIAVDRDGNILVADSNNNRIEKFDTSGKFLAKFGSLGSGDGQFSKPEAVAADSKGNIWVSDYLNARVQKFDEERKFLKAFGTGTLGGPMGLSVDPASGNVWVADWQKNRVSVYNSNGELQSQVGSGPGSGNGQLNHPATVAIDNQGNAWVGDKENNRIERFNLAGQYVGQFGSAGAGQGQFALDFPMGIATDSKGHLWVSDPGHSRVQGWLTANYLFPTAKELKLNDGDPSVDVQSSASLVSAVIGGQAGENLYQHVGNRLTSYKGPEGEAKYTYDTAGHMTKVTLPNNTWAEIVYNQTYGRVSSVTVDPAGSDPAKKTEFEFSDEPRRTVVIPPDAPYVTYDIGDNGSVLKWWNTQKPPELDPSGALYDNRGKDDFFWEGTRMLDARAESAEGIASIKVIANGDTLVDEQTCPKPKVIECPIEESEWVTEADLHAPGHLQLEVIATDRIGGSTSERFWVNVPQPPPIAPGTPLQPRFRDIAKFREEYGLEVVFPVKSEIERNERIFDLIKAWNEPNTPAGQVARATTERWGIPLRAADVAELEYREWYIEQNGPKIQAWGEDNHANTYAGYWVDHRAGGATRVGFTSNQAATVNELRQSGQLVAADRLGEFTAAPAHPFSELVSLQGAIGTSDGSSSGSLAGQITRIGIDMAQNKVTVGATNVGNVGPSLTAHYGGSAPISVYADSGSPQGARYTVKGAIKAGQVIGKFTGKGPEGNEYIECTAGPMAWEKVGTKPNGQREFAYFLLTAGHCFKEGMSVVRFSNSETKHTAVQRIGEQRSRLWQIYSDPQKFEDDGEAIRLDGDTWVDSKIIGGGVSHGTGPVEIGMTVCESLGYRNKVECKPIRDPAELTPFYNGIEDSGPFWQMPVPIVEERGDSGSPVYSPATGKIVGINVFGPPSTFTPLLGPPLPEKGPYPYFHPDRSQAPGLLNEPFMGDLHLLSE
jgi:tripartite motif-containing protein 71